MDKERVIRLRRILKVHEQKERMIKYDIAVLESEIRRCEEESEELVSHWGDLEGELRSVMTQAITRRLEVNNRKKRQNKRQKTTLLDQLSDQKRKTTMIGKNHDKAVVSFERSEEKKLLQEIAELHADPRKVRPG